MSSIGYLSIQELVINLPDGRPLIKDATFSLGGRERACLIGENGTGKTTILRALLGEVRFSSGNISVHGSPGVLRQVPGGATVGEMLAETAGTTVTQAYTRLIRAERAAAVAPSDQTHMALAESIADWDELGGFELEATWDRLGENVAGRTFRNLKDLPVEHLSGGEVKRLLLESLLRGPLDPLLLDEPDNYLDVEGKQWLEDQLTASEKAVLVISHDRYLLHRVATKVVTIERHRTGNRVWVHPGSFDGWAEARTARVAAVEEDRRRWNEQRARLDSEVKRKRQEAKNNDKLASRLKAAKSRLARFERDPHPERIMAFRGADVTFEGSRTGKLVLRCEGIGVPGTVDPFNLELFAGDRVALVGSNGVGKSALMHLLATATSATGADSERRIDVDRDPQTLDIVGKVQTGTGVRAGYFSQTNRRSDLDGETLLGILHHGHKYRTGIGQEEAGEFLARYGLAAQSRSTYEALSGGQQARFQLLLLELETVNLLFLDEPTDNLDVDSAESVQRALQGFSGAAVAITHDRWFAQSFDKFLNVTRSGQVIGSMSAPW